jgi:plastocyanin
MASRASIPLIICLSAATVAGLGLARPGADNGASPPADLYGAEQASTGQPEAESAPAASIGIAGFDFEQPVTVKAGQLVQVPNSDSAPHTLSATDGSFDTGNIDGGQTGSFTAPTVPGTYEFFCRLHPSMTGTLTVEA